VCIFFEANRETKIIRRMKKIYFRVGIKILNFGKENA
jgi:hypothetical protein